jgi:hypothetical protein
MHVAPADRPVTGLPPTALVTGGDGVGEFGRRLLHGTAVVQHDAVGHHHAMHDAVTEDPVDRLGAQCHARRLVVAVYVVGAERARVDEQFDVGHVPTGRLRVLVLDEERRNRGERRASAPGSGRTQIVRVSESQRLGPQREPLGVE